MKATTGMNDADVRRALKRELFLRHAADPHTVIIEELGILHGSARVDLAVVNGTLHGYELKSDRDDLQRLPKQVAAYATVFDLVTLVAGERHLRRALDLIPNWWGIKVARNEFGRAFFCDLKLPIANPSTDPMSVVRLLWRDEALALAQELSLHLVQPVRRRDSIYGQLVRYSDFDCVRARVRDCLKTRPNWRAGGQLL
jgi:hypothetical protein